MATAKCRGNGERDSTRSRSSIGSSSACHAGPEDRSLVEAPRRRPRPDGTGTLRLLTSCSRDRSTLAGTARESYPWGEAKAHVERPVRRQIDTSERRSY